MHKEISEPEFVYKWLPEDIVSKWLRYGISFSDVDSFWDKTEFSANYRKMTNRELREYLSHLKNEYKYDTKALIKQIVERIGRNSFKEELRLSAEREYPEWLKNKLKKTYYVCCLTYDERLDFSWSDENKKPRVRLKLNYRKLKEFYRNNIQLVKYNEHRPYINHCDDIRKSANDIIFTKLRYNNKRDYKHEKEVRIALCLDLLSYKDKLNVFKTDENEPYVYHSFFHECLEEIAVTPKTSERLIQEWNEIISLNHTEEIASCFQGLLPISDTELQQFVKSLSSSSLEMNDELEINVRLNQIHKFKALIDSYYPQEKDCKIFLQLIKDQEVTKKTKEMLACKRFKEELKIIAIP